MLALALLFACKEPAPADDSAPPEPVVVTYIGSTAGQTPDGSYAEDPKELLFIRVVDEAASTITEYGWEVGRTLTDFSLVNTVDAAAGTFSATFPTEEGTLAVEGGFDAGEAWAWTAWHSTSTYGDGDYLGWTVRSEDTLDEAGQVTAHKSVFDDAGVETWQIVEELPPVDRAAFEARLGELGGVMPF